MPDFAIGLRLFAVLLVTPLWIGCSERSTPAPQEAAAPAETTPQGHGAEDGTSAGETHTFRPEIPEPAEFTPDPDALSAHELAKEVVAAGEEGSDDLKRKYEGRVITLEGRVAVIEPYDQKNTVGLYGFETNEFEDAFDGDYHFHWDAGGAVAQRRRGQLVQLAAAEESKLTPRMLLAPGALERLRPDYKPRLRTALRVGQPVRVRGRVANAGPHGIILEAATFLAVGPVPDGTPERPPIRARKHWESVAEFMKEDLAPLKELGASVGVGSSAYDGYPQPDVSLDEGEYTDAGLIKPEVFTELQEFDKLQLELDEFAGDDAALAQVARLTNLSALRINLRVPGFNDEFKHRATAAGLAKLAALENLVHLEIRNAGDDVRDDALLSGGSELAALSALKNLEVLTLRNIALDDESVAFVQELSNLYGLTLASERLTNAALPDWSRHPELRVLDLSLCDVTNEGLSGLTACDKLRRLSLRETQVDAGLFPLLQELDELGLLDLGGTEIGATDLPFLSGNRLITHVLLDHTSVGDAAMRTLVGLPHLKYVSVEGTDVTDAGITAFAEGSGRIEIVCSEDTISYEAKETVEDARNGARVSREF